MSVQMISSSPMSARSAAADKVVLPVPLKPNKMLDSFQLLHFHLGSQISAIRSIKNALREAGRFYTELVKMGVQFRVCKVTLQRRNIDPKRVIEEATLVPSGVAEVARLQAKEGFVYLKP